MAGGNNAIGAVEGDQRMRGYGYRADEEMNVYDQSCENCCNPNCPLRYPVAAEEHMEFYGTLADYDAVKAKKDYEEVEQRRKEDGITHNGELVWCVNWEGGRSR